MSSKLKLLVRGSGLRALQTVIGVAVGLFMMPFLISQLGDELYGLWIVITSVVATYYLLDMGFNQAVTRYVVKFIHQENPNAANSVINTALIIYSVLGMCVLLISAIASLFFTEQLMENESNISLAKVILIISGLSIAFEFPSKAFPGIISAYMRFDVIAGVRFSKTLLDALLIYIFVKNGFGLVSMALITFSTGVLSTFFFVKYSTSLFSDLKFGFKYVDKRTFIDVLNFSKWVFMFDVSATIRDKMDIWLISFYLGLSMLPVYYVAVRLVDYSISFLQQATNLSTPLFTEYHAKNDEKRLATSFSLFLKINVVAGSIVVAGLYVVGKNFIGIWMGDAVDNSLAYICLVILSLGRFTVYFSTPIQSMFMTKNKHNRSAVIALVETVISGILCFILIPKYGVMGAAIAISIPYAVGRLFLMPFFVVRLMELGYMNLFMRIILFWGLQAFFAYGLSEIVDKANFKGLSEIIVLSFLIVLVSILFSVVIWDSDEKRTLGLIGKKLYLGINRQKL